MSERLDKFLCERIGPHSLYLGDCREILPLIGKIDCIVTDPPFGINYQSGRTRSAESWIGGGRIANDLTCEARDEALSLAGDCPKLVFGSRRAPTPLGTRMVLTWDKGPALGMGALDLPWKPSSEEIYVIGHGFIGSRDEGAVLYCPPVQSMAKNGRVHPNEKPIPLLQRLIRKMPGSCVLDPFMGSASTGVACVKLGRRFIGIEIDARYFDVACARIQDAHNRPDLFIEQPREKPVQDALTFEVAS